MQGIQVNEICEYLRISEHCICVWWLKLHVASWNQEGGAGSFGMHCVNQVQEMSDWWECNLRPKKRCVNIHPLARAHSRCYLELPSTLHCSLLKGRWSLIIDRARHSYNSYNCEVIGLQTDVFIKKHLGRQIQNVRHRIKLAEIRRGIKGLS